MARNFDAKANVEWKGKETILKASKRLDANAQIVGMFLSGKVVKLISKGQPAKRVGVKKPRLIGLNPSKPGKPPKLLHGNLRNSINHRTKRSRGHISIYIGANTPYARALEYGNPKGNLEERPYLRPTLRKHRKKAIEKLVKGIFK